MFAVVAVTSPRLLVPWNTSYAVTAILSVAAVQDSPTEVVVTSVTARLVGTVGACVSAGTVPSIAKPSIAISPCQEVPVVARKRNCVDPS